jgi:hypothetical protein
MKRHCFFRGGAFLAWILLTLRSALAQDVSLYVIGKVQVFEQTGTNVTPPLSEALFAFTALVVPAPAGAVTDVVLRLPSGALRRLTESAGILWLEQKFFSKNEMDARFPAGAYSFTNYTTSQGLVAGLTLRSDSYPPRPRLANWDAAQSIATNQPFTLQWQPFVGGTTEDFIRVSIEDASGQEVFCTGLMGQTNGLNGLATVATIPADTLAPGQTYRGHLLFLNVTGLNATNIPGALGAAGYFRRTDFDLKTLNPAGTLQFQAGSYFTNENAGFALVTVERVGGSNGTVTVRYTADVETTLTFEPGVTSTNLLVEIVNDDEPEGYEVYALSLDDPTGGANLGAPSVATLTIIDDDDWPPAPNVRSYAMGKGQLLVQDGPGAPRPDPDGRFCFVASAQPAFPGAIRSATLRRPNRTTRALTAAGLEDRFSFKQQFYTMRALDANFPTGSYTLTLRTATDGARAPVLNVPPGQFPKPPHILNWEVMQRLDLEAEVELTWEPFPGARTNDFIQLRIEDRFGSVILDTEADPETRLMRTSTSAILPVGDLGPDQTYQAHLRFVRVRGVNRTGYPGVPGVVAYFSETRFQIVTAPDPPPRGRFKFSSPLCSTNENGVEILFTVLRTGGAAGQARVDVVASDLTAQAGVDYEVPMETLNFGDGEFSATFPLPIHDDAEFEGDKKFLLALRNPTDGADLGYPSRAEMVILEDDPRPDPIPPRLTIRVPTNGTRVADGPVLVRGAATDNLGVGSVEYQLISQRGTSDWMPADTQNAWTNWTVALADLDAGTNIIRVRARDAITNYSAVAARTVFHVTRQWLTLATNGPGAILPDLTNKNLIVGQGYTLTAAPQPGFILSNWNRRILPDGPLEVISDWPRLTFLMQTGLCLQANFVPNPFLALKGKYSGLYYSVTNGVEHETSGFFTLALTDRGAYSAKLLGAGAVASLSGRFDLNGRATNVTMYAGRPAIEWTLDLDPSSAGQITGCVIYPDDESTLVGDRAPNYGTGASPYRGRYTLIIPGDPGATDRPGGDSFGAVTVTREGALSLSGVLADGAIVAQSVPLSTTGMWPLYASLYGGHGSILGWVQVNTNPSPAINLLSERVSWIKPPLTNSVAYSNGFQIETNLTGSAYQLTQPVLPFTTGLVAFAGMNLEAPFANGAALTRTNRVLNLGPQPGSMAILGSNGLFAGAVILPGTTNRISFRGALLQRQSKGSGFFLRDSRSGRAEFGPMPAQ